MNAVSNIWSRWSVRKRIIVSTVFLVILIVLIVGFFTGIERVGPKISEGVSLSSPARTAFGVLCSENKLRPGLSWNDPLLAEFDLAKPDQYQGEYVKSVSLLTLEGGIGTITIVYKEITDRFLVFPVNRVEDGATVIYRGDCGPGGIRWSIDPASTVSERFRPRT